PFSFTRKRFAETGDASIIWEGHKAGREIGYCHMEKLTNLDKLPAFGFKVCCFPVKIAAASAGWPRRVAMLNDSGLRRAGATTQRIAAVVSPHLGSRHRPVLEVIRRMRVGFAVRQPRAVRAHAVHQEDALEHRTLDRLLQHRHMG